MNAKATQGWKELLENEYFDQWEFLAEYTTVEKHPVYKKKSHGNCPYCKCSGTFTAMTPDGSNEVLVSCTGAHKKKMCGMTGNLLDMVILIEELDMTQALARISAWVGARMPKFVDEVESTIDLVEVANPNDQIQNVGTLEEYAEHVKRDEPVEYTQEEHSGDWITGAVTNFKKKRGRKKGKQ
jgi:hypothetical protein